MSFYLSKILWLIINPFNILLFFSLLTILLLLLNIKKLGIFSLYFFLILLLSFGFFPFGKYLTYCLEKSYHNSYIPNHVDGILILGGATEPFLSKEFDQINFTSSAERLVESVTLIKKYKNAKIIFSSGSGSITYPKLGHAEVAKKFFVKMGLDTNRIFFENKSRNTYENILFSKHIANPIKNEKWLLVTSARHMNRAIFIGQKVDWALIPYAVDFNVPKKIKFKLSFNILSNLNFMQKASHEWVGLIAYYIMGRTSRIY